MRPVLVVLVVVVILAIVAVATGFVNLSGQPGEVPKVAVEGGKLPSVDADVGDVDVGTTNTTVPVPEVDVSTKREKVELPSIDVKKANEE